MKEIPTHPRALAYPVYKDNPTEDKTMFDVTSQPATRIVAAALSDTVDLDQPCRYFHVGVAGNVRFIPANQDTPVTLALGAGVAPFTARRIYTTNTTATGIFVCYTD